MNKALKTEKWLHQAPSPPPPGVLGVLHTSGVLPDSNETSAAWSRRAQQRAWQPLPQMDPNK